MSTSNTSISPRGWGMIVFLFMLGAINFADKTVIGLAAEPISKQLHLSASQWGLVGGSFYFLFSVSSITIAPIADAIGSKRVLALLASTWVIIQIATIFIVKFPLLLLTRVLLGAGEGPSYPVSTYAITRWLPQVHRTKGLALMTLGSALGPAIIVPLLALVISVSWRLAFGLLGGVGLLWVVLWVFWVREHPEREVSQETSRVLAPLLAGMKKVFTRPMIIIVLGGFAGYWYLALLVTWMPSYLIQVRHLHLNNPWYLVGVSLPWLVGGIVQMGVGVYSDHQSRRKGGIRQACTLLLGVVLITGAALFALVTVIPWTPVAIILLACSPLGAVFPLVATLLADSPVEYQSAVQGIGVGIYSLAGIIAPVVTGAIIQHAGKFVVSGYTMAYLVACILILLIGFAIVRDALSVIQGNSASSDVSSSPDNDLDLIAN